MDIIGSINQFYATAAGAVALSIFGLISVLRSDRSALGRLKKLNRTRARISQTTLFVALAAYMAELIAGLLILFNQDRQEMLVVLIYVIIALTAVGLMRTWELLGINKILNEGTKPR